MADFIKCLEVFSMVKEITNELNVGEFTSIFCMLAEEYCRVNDLDVCELMNEMTSQVQIVNDTFGKYVEE